MTPKLLFDGFSLFMRSRISISMYLLLLVCDLIPKRILNLLIDLV